MKTVTVREVAELKTVATDLLATVRVERPAATVVALHGDLGAGKTTFTQALAETLGVAEPVVSPTFVVMKMYEVEAPGGEPASPVRRLVHIDAYRIESNEEMTVLKFQDLLDDPANLILIEWAEKITDLLPPHTIHLSFSINADHSRTITINDQTN